MVISKAFAALHDHLEPRSALDREVGTLGAAQNPSDATAATAKHIGKIRPMNTGTVPDA
jgi:hypothetical protein